MYITSDLHFGHKNVLKFTVRPFKDLDEMKSSIIDEINTKVEPTDILYHLGDLYFGKSQEELRELLSEIKCRIHFIRGNHDHDNFVKVMKEFGHVDDYKELKVNGQLVVLCHYPLAFWRNAHYGSTHFFGHCLDVETELLTTEGWKTYDQILDSDTVYSYNPSTKQLVESKINKVIRYKYTGDMVYINTNKFSMCVTDEHRIVGINKGNKKYSELLAKDWASLNYPKLNIIRSGELDKNTGIDLSDDELRLYICLAADGTLANSSLGRLKVFKERKLEYFRSILGRLGITYSDNTQKDGSTCYNFTIPPKILEFNIKGLDTKLLQCTKKQALVILEAYENTDGHRYDNSVVIYSSKLQEIELLQHMFSISGLQASKSARFGHGFSKTWSYELTVTDKSLQSVNPSNSKIINVVNTDIWCLQVPEGNFMVRRNGKVFITGNCHSRYQHPGRAIDVGYDSFFKILEFSEAMDLAKAKPIHETY